MFSSLYTQNYFSYRIFVEKIVEHPEYHILSPTERSQFNPKIKDVFPKTEALKQKLLQLFHEEHEAYKNETVSRHSNLLLTLKNKMSSDLFL